MLKPSKLLSSLSQRKLNTLLKQNREHRKYTRKDPYCDKWKALVSSGRGGDGRSAFMHLMNTEFAGPAGGNGGRGGHVLLVATNKRQDLGHLRDLGYHIQAGSGANGDAKDMIGSNGTDMILDVPIGTVVHDIDNNEVLHDLDREGGVLLLEGGAGGKGNRSFAHATNHSPKECTRGLPGNSLLAQFELKTLADIALVGYPNSGKSSFLGTITKCQPKVAAYAFTTLYPMVGHIYNELGDRVTVADLPGLIEGAYANRGLGHQFLRHVERAKAIIYVLDMSNNGYIPDERVNPQSPSEVLFALQMELEYYMPGLSERAIMVLANKMDLLDKTQTSQKCEELCAATHLPCVPISCVNYMGIEQAIHTLFTTVKGRSSHIEAKHQEVEKLLIQEENERTAAKQVWLRGREVEKREVWANENSVNDNTSPKDDSFRYERLTRGDNDFALCPLVDEPEPDSLVDLQVFGEPAAFQGYSVVTNTTQYVTPPQRQLSVDKSMHGQYWKLTREQGETLPDEGFVRMKPGTK